MRCYVDATVSGPLALFLGLGGSGDSSASRKARGARRRTFAAPFWKLWEPLGIFRDGVEGFCVEMGYANPAAQSPMANLGFQGA